jgi:hypothetical protein
MNLGRHRSDLRGCQGNIRAPVSTYECGPHISTRSPYPILSLRGGATRKHKTESKKHYIVTEQYQNNRESVNKCVLFVSQRFST